MCQCGKLHNNAKRLTVEQDPTRQGANRARAEKEFGRRMAGALKEVRSLLRSLRFDKAVAPDGNSVLLNRAVYTYQQDPYLEIKPAITEIIERWLETKQPIKPQFWWFDEYIRIAYDSGASDSISNIESLLIAAGIISSFGGRSSFEQISVSYQYSRRQSYSFESTYSTMEKFTADLASDTTAVIAEQMKNGVGVAAVIAAAALAFSVKQGRAKTIAFTQIQDAYRDARQLEAEALAAQEGVIIKVLHRSALLPTTRAHHAARHGRIFTIQEQAVWWSQDANSINCYCSVYEVLVTQDGRIIDNGMQKKLERQRLSYFGLKQ